MDTSLKTNTIEYFSPVWHGTDVRELTEEVVVPDSMEDVGTILDAAGILTMQGKETLQDSVQLSASLAVAVLYAPENAGGLRGIDLTIPADIRMEASGADMDCRTFSSIRVRSVEARLINSRKIHVRAELETDVSCFRRDCLRIATGMGDEDAPVHLRCENTEAVLVSDIREKTFALTDEYAFPAALGSDLRVLSRRAQIVTEDVKYVGGKVLFRGLVRSELMFADRETENCAVGQYETEFSQIMEVDADGENSMPEVRLFLTGAYYDMPEFGRDGRIQAELHLAAQCVCRERRSIQYIADLYSNRTELAAQRTSLRLVCGTSPVVMRQTVVDRIEGAARDAELLQATAAVGSVIPEEGAVRATVNVRLVYGGTNGEYSVSQGRLSAEFTPPESSSMGDTLRDADVILTDIYCVPGTGDVRVSLRLDAVMEGETEICCVSAVEEDEEAWESRERTPSAVLLRVSEGTDLWAVARRYRSTVEDILQINEGRKDGMLLIPKGR